MPSVSFLSINILENFCLNSFHFLFLITFRFRFLSSFGGFFRYDSISTPKLDFRSSENFFLPVSSISVVLVMSSFRKFTSLLTLSVIGLYDFFIITGITFCDILEELLDMMDEPDGSRSECAVA